MSKLVSTAISGAVIYGFIKLISTPFEKWDAYKDGAIDKDGKTIKGHEDVASWNRFTILCRNIKNMMAKVPFIGKSSLFHFASALWLLKEETGVDCSTALAEYMEIEPDLQMVNEEIDYGFYWKDNAVLQIESGPIGTIYGYNIFECFNIVTEERVIATKYELELLPGKKHGQVN